MNKFFTTIEELNVNDIIGTDAGPKKILSITKSSNNDFTIICEDNVIIERTHDQGNCITKFLPDVVPSVSSVQELQSFIDKKRLIVEEIDSGSLDIGDIIILDDNSLVTVLDVVQPRCPDTHAKIVVGINKQPNNVFSTFRDTPIKVVRIQ